MSPSNQENETSNPTTATRVPLGFLVRLARDKRGATLPMLAAAMLPLAGVIGSGLDLSRAYMTKAKLQTACDAAALATRRHMASGTELTTASIAEGQKFFRFNFPPGTMQSTTVTPTIRLNATDRSVVEVIAQTQVPTTLLSMFGKETIALTAECSADQDFVNNDIMLVLDVTLSMNCAVGSPGGTYCPTEQANSRISRLRASGASLYAALEGATGVRTRYGFMPFSLTVNVGGSLPRATGLNRPQWIRDPARYWDRNSSTGTYSFASITHADSWFNISPTTWTGCVEERSTIGRTDSSIGNPQIVNAVSRDDIDTVSTTTASQQWQPYDPVAQEAEAGVAGLGSFCPQPATRLTEYTTRAAYDTAFQAGLTRAGGYTFHDIGMMWGMRFLSTTGMFSADNPASLPMPGGGPAVRVDKHIIFFTDGALEVNRQTYSAYGVDERDNRMISAAGNQQEAKHRAHFLSSCDRARQMGMTVWVIALDVNDINEIRPCASGNDHFFISDGSDLTTIFSSIGKGIGKLRITR